MTASVSHKLGDLLAQENVATSVHLRSANHTLTGRHTITTRNGDP